MDDSETYLSGSLTRKVVRRKGLQHIHPVKKRKGEYETFKPGKEKGRTKRYPVHEIDENN